LLRPHYPKGTNFAKVFQTHINRVVERLNYRPRKRLCYLIPVEMFWGNISEHDKRAVLWLLINSAIKKII